MDVCAGTTNLGYSGGAAVDDARVGQRLLQLNHHGRHLGPLRLAPSLCGGVVLGLVALVKHQASVEASPAAPLHNLLHARAGPAPGHEGGVGGEEHTCARMPTTTKSKIGELERWELERFGSVGD